MSDRLTKLHIRQKKQNNREIFMHLQSEIIRKLTENLKNMYEGQPAV